jgi:2-acylglycerol O-acyltransferase 2
VSFAGQFLSASLIKVLTPGHMICGTGADIVFAFPLMRQLFAWLGTHPASRANIGKIFKKGYHCAVMPGGIAEMYLASETEEKIFLKKRRNTVKVAIQEGANIVVLFAFGNTRLFHTSGKNDSSSLLAKISRKLRASIVFFWPVPKRHPIKLATGEIVPVQQCDDPTEAQIDDVMNRLIKSIEKVYVEKKPDWEQRPLIIT